MTAKITGNVQFDAVREMFRRCNLPQNLEDRLLQDMQSTNLYRRVSSVDELDCRRPNSSYFGSVCTCCKITVLVHDGNIGLLEDQGDYYFLAPGYHKYPVFGREYHGEVTLQTYNRPVTIGCIGFVTITEGNIGVLNLGSDYALLAPGTYQWSSAMVHFESAVNITTSLAQLGPYCLVTVPQGRAAVTYCNGELRVLGESDDSARNAAGRTFFLDDPKWVTAGFLDMQVQTDRLEGNDLLSKDNVELLMVAMSQWRIVNPVLAVTYCASGMDEIRMKVNQLVRATIARIVAGTNIGQGPVSGSVSQPMVVGIPTNAGPGAAPHDDADLAHLMQSEQATRHMGELTAHMTTMGVEVAGVYVPEKRMKNDDIRNQVAKQAVIGIKAEAERSAADAKAYATLRAANAEAEAIGILATAHANAGDRLGQPTSTASRLALTESSAKALQTANITIFSGAPDQMPFMFTSPPTGSK